MRFWFVHSGEVPLREQIVAQVQLGILSGELGPGERLPSVRELARRFGLHANTISAGYKQLVEAGWVESRRGSGVFVQQRAPVRPSATTPSISARELAFERVLANFFQATTRLGLSDADVLARVQQWAAREIPRRVCLLEPDPQLRRIVQAELAELLPPSIPLEACGLQDVTAGSPALAGSLVVVLPSKLESARAHLRSQQSGTGASPGLLALRVRSVPSSLAQALPRDVQAHAGSLVGIASGWDEFLRFAHTMLIATGFAPEALVVRHTAEPGWQGALRQTAAVVCDALTAAELSPARAIVFRLLHEEVAEDLHKALRLDSSQIRTSPA